MEEILTVLADKIPDETLIVVFSLVIIGLFMRFIKEQRREFVQANKEQQDEFIRANEKQQKAFTDVLTDFSEKFGKMSSQMDDIEQHIKSRRRL